jgi:hypothetical protein
VEIWNFMQIGFNFVGELKTATVGNLPTERAAEEEVMWGWLKYNKFQRYQKQGRKSRPLYKAPMSLA